LTNANVSKQKENIDKNKKNVVKNPYQTTNDNLLSPDFAYIGGPANDLLHVQKIIYNVPEYRF
jgi:hypothetical protein